MEEVKEIWKLIYRFAGGYRKEANMYKKSSKIKVLDEAYETFLYYRCYKLFLRM